MTTIATTAAVTYSNTEVKLSQLLLFLAKCITSERCFVVSCTVADVAV